MPRANPRAACGLALIALIALCALGACIGPGLEPPKESPGAGLPRAPASHDTPDASTTGSGNFGNTDTDGTTNPETPPAQPTPSGPGPVDMGSEPDADEDAGTDPADSP